MCHWSRERSIEDDGYAGANPTTARKQCKRSLRVISIIVTGVKDHSVTVIVLLILEVSQGPRERYFGHIGKMEEWPCRLQNCSARPECGERQRFTSVSPLSDSLDRTWSDPLPPHLPLSCLHATSSMKHSDPPPAGEVSSSESD